MIKLGDIPIGAIVSKDVKENVDGGIWEDLKQAMVPELISEKYKHKICLNVPKEELEKIFVNLYRRTG
nr:hypothetical protein [uncultured Lachnoclostridium sp.]